MTEQLLSQEEMILVDDKNRNIVFCADVTIETVKEAIEQILEINAFDEMLKESDPDYEPKPINVVVVSYGGELESGFGIIGAMETSKTPVHTTCFGIAGSMGLAIFLAGRVRKAHRFATFMYHESSQPHNGKLTQNIQSIKVQTKQQKLYDDYILSKTNINTRQISKIKNKIEDWYLTAEEALKLGIVHEIIGSD